MAQIKEQIKNPEKELNKMDAKRTTPRHIIIKMPKVKDKEKILKAEIEKQFVTYRGVPLRLSADFPKETLQARRQFYGNSFVGNYLLFSCCF